MNAAVPAAVPVCGAFIGILTGRPEGPATPWEEASASILRELEARRRARREAARTESARPGPAEPAAAG